MSQLRISIAGLCLFNFDPPLKGGQKPTQVQVLLRRLNRARPLSRVVNSQPEVLDQHFPLLEFDLANYDPASTREADFHCQPDARGRMTKGVCLLNGEDLTIHSDGESESLLLSRSEPSNRQDPQTPADKDTLWWMVTLDDVFPNNPLNPLIRDGAPGSNQPILARLTLDQGYLRTQDLTNAPCTIIGAGPSGFNRRVATSFAHELGCKRTVEIEMKKVRNGRTATRKLTLNAENGNDVEIGIFNMEIDRFIGADPTDGPRSQADFEVFADLLTEGIKGPKPFLLETTPGGSSGCCGRANCLVTGG